MTTAADSTPKTEAAPAQPQTVDVAAIAREAAQIATVEATKNTEKIAEKRAGEIATERLRQVGNALAGNEPVDNTKVALEQFVGDPIKMLHSLKEVTKREMRAEQDERNKVHDTQQKIVSPFISEYPELNSRKRLALVEKLADDYVSSGKTYEDALKSACEDTVKEFNLKSVSESEREGNSSFGLPSGGGHRSGAPKFSEDKSQDDFLKSMRDKSNSVRKKA